MVRLQIHQLMTTRGITAYALSKGAAMAYPSAYRLSRPEGHFGPLGTPIHSIASAISFGSSLGSSSNGSRRGTSDGLWLQQQFTEARE